MAVLNFDKNAAFGENGTGILYIATDYDGAIFPDWDGTNESTQITTIEADYTFGDIGYFENFAPYIKKGDERIITTAYCGVGEITRKLEKITGFTVDVTEILEMTNLALILNAELRTVPAGVGVKAQELISMKRKFKTNSYQLFKFVSCPDAQGLQNTFYFVKSALASDVNIPYIDLQKDDFTGVSLDFEVAKGGNMLLKKETAPAT